MNPHILLALTTCLAMLLVTGATPIDGLGQYSSDLDTSVISTGLLPHRSRVPRQIVKDSRSRKARAKYVTQLKRLKGLECKPKWTKVSVMEYIGGENPILDEDIKPKVVLVKRCIKSCSYCGNDHGIEEKECYPDIEKNKNVIIMYTDNTVDRVRYFKVPIPQHKKCKCK